MREFMWLAKSYSEARTAPLNVWTQSAMIPPFAGRYSLPCPRVVILSERGRPPWRTTERVEGLLYGNAFAIFRQRSSSPPPLPHAPPPPRRTPPSSPVWLPPDRDAASVCSPAASESPSPAPAS